tara:strand:+ start:1726 stop:2028 length:303 start_codon:yes stop_codon:yes gene_type:complete
MKKKHYKLDKELIKKLATIHCTYQEIADVVGTSTTTLEKSYKDLIEHGRAEGKKSLRRKQMEVALEKGDVRMLIWLGRNLLDQKDSPENTENNQPLPWAE